MHNYYVLIRNNRKLLKGLTMNSSWVNESSTPLTVHICQLTSRAGSLEVCLCSQTTCQSKDWPSWRDSWAGTGSTKFVKWWKERSDGHKGLAPSESQVDAGCDSQRDPVLAADLWGGDPRLRKCWAQIVSAVKLKTKNKTTRSLNRTRHRWLRNLTSLWLSLCESHIWGQQDGSVGEVFAANTEHPSSIPGMHTVGENRRL